MTCGTGFELIAAAALLSWLLGGEVGHPLHMGVRVGCVGMEGHKHTMCGYIHVHVWLHPPPPPMLCKRKGYERNTEAMRGSTNPPLEGKGASALAGRKWQDGRAGQNGCKGMQGHAGPMECL